MSNFFKDFLCPFRKNSKYLQILSGKRFFFLSCSKIHKIPKINLFIKICSSVSKILKLFTNFGSNIRKLFEFLKCIQIIFSISSNFLNIFIQFSVIVKSFIRIFQFSTKLSKCWASSNNYLMNLVHIRQQNRQLVQNFVSNSIKYLKKSVT